LIGNPDSFKFTIGEKHPHTLDNGVPGPGTYDPLDHLTKENSPSKTISGSNRFGNLPEELRNQPGPGHYDANMSLQEPRSPLGKINPIPSHETGVRDTPGPGTYDPELSAVKERAPSAKIAKSKRDFLTISASDLLAQPGPGYYNPSHPGNS
jgi:Sperm-tail PG-rich repeat